MKLPSHVAPLAKLAAPLVMSMSTVTILQVIDAIVLGHHSETAVAAMGPSSLAIILVQGVLFGTTGYAGTWAATARGAGDTSGERRAAWLGMKLSLAFGITALLAAWPLGLVFFHLGHAPEVASGEAIYFRVLVAGSVFPVLSAALSGWLSGIGRTRDAFLVSLVSFAVNTVLTPPLALGWFGLPALGLLGAALGTVAAQAAAVVVLLETFRRADGFRHPEERVAAPGRLREFLGLALPQGLRISVELLAWTVFLVFIGRLGTEPLAASSIAFRINGMAFFPALGIGQAAAILVAQARGAGKLSEIRPIAFQALGLGAIWMTAFAAAFLLFPGLLLDLFEISHPETRRMGVVILRFVAFYCLFDAANVILASVLSALGDTRWTLWVFLGGSTAFIAGLGVADHARTDVSVHWALATLFVVGTALAWLGRFQAKAPR